MNAKEMKRDEAEQSEWEWEWDIERERGKGKTDNILQSYWVLYVNDKVVRNTVFINN